MNIVEAADRIAEEAHKGVMRKWQPEQYIVHPRRCSAMAKQMGYGEVLQAAMLCHDVIEDVGAGLAPEERERLKKHYAERIKNECGQAVLHLVLELTFPTEGDEWEGRPRAEKNAVREKHMRGMSKLAMVGKMIDTNDNYRDMAGAPKRLIQKTRDEGWVRYDILKDADPKMATILKEAIVNLSSFLKG